MWWMLLRERAGVAEISKPVESREHGKAYGASVLRIMPMKIATHFPSVRASSGWVMSHVSIACPMPNTTAIRRLAGTSLRTARAR